MEEIEKARLAAISDLIEALNTMAPDAASRGTLSINVRNALADLDEAFDGQIAIFGAERAAARIRRVRFARKFDSLTETEDRS